MSIYLISYNNMWWWTSFSPATHSFLPFSSVTTRGSSPLFWLWLVTAPSATTTSGMDGPQNWAAATPWCATSSTTRSSSSDTSGAGSQWVTLTKLIKITQKLTYIQILQKSNIHWNSLSVSVPQVMIDIDGQHEWRDCLDIPGVQLPLGYYFGASAMTGDLSGKQPSPS